MATKTKNYGLKKPDLNDFYNIDDFNGNADILDAQLKTVSELASTDQTGLNAHTADTGNPHNVTKAQIGLGNVDNTADAAKKVLSAAKLTTARAINGISFDGTADITLTDSTKEPLIATKNSAFNKSFEDAAANIKMNGSRSAGNLDTLARADHVHPTDSSRAAASHTHGESEISGLVADLAAKAPLASPALAGTPTVPTAPEGTNSPQIASTAFVNAAFNNGVSKTCAVLTSGADLNNYKTAGLYASPVPAVVSSLLNSPNSSGSEGALKVERLGSDSYLSQTYFLKSALTMRIYTRVWNSSAWGSWAELTDSNASQTLANKTLANPVITGTPTAPTAAADTNTTQLATTAFVLGQAASSAPAMAGTAAVGTAKKFARADHVHPTDTSRAAASHTHGESEIGGLTADLAAKLNVSAKASQAQAEAGTDDTNYMTALKTNKAIAKLAPKAKTELARFTSSANWTVPTGVTDVDVYVVGGGGAGGGGGTKSSYGGAGGGGGYCKLYRDITVTPNSSIAIVVGAGGTSAATGGSGGQSYFQSTSYAAAGGSGGTANYIGGAGGSGGGAGGGAYGGYDGGSAGGSGGNSGGAGGGNTSYYPINPYDGIAYGCGGGGGATGGGGTGGGAGGRGGYSNNPTGQDATGIGGGGGGAYSPGAGGAGATGGGGGGGACNESSTTFASGAGGCGIVIIYG